MEPENQATKSASYDDEMWSRIKAIPHYYDKLELMPGAKEMVSFAENIEGCTATDSRWRHTLLDVSQH